MRHSKIGSPMTLWVKLDRVGRGDPSIRVRNTANTDHKFNTSASIPLCQFRLAPIASEPSHRSDSTRCAKALNRFAIVASQEETQGKIDIVFEDTGEQQLKNVARRVRVYRVRLEEKVAKARQICRFPTSHRLP